MNPVKNLFGTTPTTMPLSMDETFPPLNPASREAFAASSDSTLQAPPTDTETPDSINFGKFVKSLHTNFPEYSLNRIQNIARYVFNIQKTVICPSISIVTMLGGIYDFPNAFAVTKNTFELIIKKAGQGSNGTVYKTVSFPTENFQDGYTSEPSTPSKSRVRAMKRSSYKRLRYSPAKEVLDGCFSKRQKGVTPITSIATDQEGFSCCFQPLRDIDYSQLDLSNFHNPVEATIKTLLDPTAAIAIAHSKGLIYKDFRADNLLVVLNESGEVERGEFTDFDPFGPTQSQRHGTDGTWEHFAPDVFDSLVDQRNRIGIQTTESDVFTLGAVIGTEMLIKLVNNAVRNNPWKELAVRRYIQNIYPTKIYGPFTDRALRANDGPSGSYKIYYGSNGPSAPEHILVCPSTLVLELLLKKLGKEIKDYFSSPTEYQAFLKLAKLSCSMRKEFPKERPTMDAVHIELQSILDMYPQVPSSEEFFSASDDESLDSSSEAFSATSDDELCGSLSEDYFSGTDNDNPI